MAGRMINYNGQQLDEDTFRQKVANNEIEAGPGGSWAQQAIDSGVYSGNPTPNGGTGAMAAKANQNQSSTGSSTANTMAANMGTPSPVSGQTVGDPSAYEFGPRNDDPMAWSQRAFRQGLADFGPSNMNPFIEQNGNALLPYQQWVQSRYGTSAGLNQQVASMLGGGDMSEGNWKDRFQQMIGSNQLGPTSTGGAMQNMGGMKNLIDNVAAGKTQGMDPSVVTWAQKIISDPNLANQYGLAQFSGLGGYIGSFLGQKLNNLSQQYTGNVQMSNGSQGSYWDLMMKMLGGS